MSNSKLSPRDGVVHAFAALRQYYHSNQPDYMQHIIREVNLRSTLARVNRPHWRAYWQAYYDLYAAHLALNTLVHRAKQSPNQQNQLLSD